MGKVVDNVYTNLRYERKFVYTNQLVDDIIEQEVLSNSFCFREIYHRRSVNNLYLDDPEKSFYRQNVAGDDKRLKYRLRWYSDDFNTIKNPTLEIKKKFGAVGDKDSFKLKKFNFDLETSSVEEFQKAAENELLLNGEKGVHANLLNLQPALFNSYERRYFLSDCERYRITIDYNMAFYNPYFGNFKRSQENLSDVVLELKYAISDDKESRQLTQNLQARLSKHSKYVRGMDLINHLLHV